MTPFTPPFTPVHSRSLPGFDLADIITKIEDKNWWGVTVIPETSDGPRLNGNKIEWNFDRGYIFNFWTKDSDGNGNHISRDWWAPPNLVGLVHEIGHAYDGWGGNPGGDPEIYAMGFENIARWGFYRRVPGCRENGRFYVAPRARYGWDWSDNSRGYPDMSWAEFFGGSANGWPVDGQ